MRVLIQPNNSMSFFFLFSEVALGRCRSPARKRNRYKTPAIQTVRGHFGPHSTKIHARFGEQERSTQTWQYNRPNAKAREATRYPNCGFKDCALATLDVQKL